MSDAQLREIRSRLDDKLSIASFERDYRSTGEAATEFFQDLFVEVLNFDETPSPAGDATWQDLPVHRWPSAARADAARLFAEAGNFRVIYVELEKLTRTAERNAVKSLTQSERQGGWALEGSFLTVFHAPDEDVWHLVTPYEEGSDDITTGRPVLRRYTLGEGETHRTVASALEQMDAGKPGRLAARIDEAFRVQPVTERFYESYKEAFSTLSSELRQKGLELEEADEYAHITLNRLMFFYYLQKKGWIGGRKDFVRWFHKEYRESDDTDCFHGKWLSALFFDGMNQPEGTPIQAGDFSDDVSQVISGLAHMNGGLFRRNELDRDEVYISDKALNTVIQEFLEQYNFTVTEESPYDIDVAVDPAMLGKIYESLIAEQERGRAGIFYTPRVEVDMMCRLSLYEQFCHHASDLGDWERGDIIDFIFTEPQDWIRNDTNKMPPIRELLHELNIVDPACGSGAFLVGMKQVITELYQKLQVTLDYELEEQIINENLYGVDVKDWAVRVAEFRLWLSLVEGEDALPEQRPVLPNFDLNLRVGDSIISKIGNEWISMDIARETNTQKIQNQREKVRHLDKQYFEGREVSKEAVQEARRELFRKHIDKIIDNSRSRGEQVSFSGESVDDDDSVSKADVENLEKIKNQIDSATEEGVIIWELACPEVMLDGGFDIVIGNPPYLSGSEIVDQSYSSERLSLMEDDIVEEIEQRYRDDLQEYVERTFDLSLAQNGDYYLYFFFRGIDLLKKGGTLTYITSNTWLDVNYGKGLQEGLLTLAELRYVFENRAKRSFSEADVNTAITIANRHKHQGKALVGNPSFMHFNRPYSEIFNPQWAKRFFEKPSASDHTSSDSVENLVESTAESLSPDDDLTEVVNETVTLRDEVLHELLTPIGRRITISAGSLWRFGGGQALEAKTLDKISFMEPHGSYEKEEWGGLFIRAPDILYEVLEECGEMLTTLDETKIDMYLKTGADKFFFVNKIKDEEGEFVRIRNREYNDEFVVEERFVKPLIKSSSQLTTIQITENDFNDIRVIVIPAETNVAQYRVQQYIKYGEEKDYDKMWRTSRQDPWWRPAPRSLEGEPLILPRTHSDNHRVFYNPERYITNRFYRATIGDDEAKFIATMLNSTFASMFFEVFGKVGLGGGALSTYKPSYQKLPIIKREYITDEEIPHMATEYFTREIGSLYEELNTESPENLDLSSIKKDRRKLDEFVMGDVLGLSEDQQLAIYQGALRLVKQRLEKSRSV